MKDEHKVLFITFLFAISLIFVANSINSVDSHGLTGYATTISTLGSSSSSSGLQSGFVNLFKPVQDLAYAIKDVLGVDVKNGGFIIFTFVFTMMFYLLLRYSPPLSSFFAEKGREKFAWLISITIALMITLFLGDQVNGLINLFGPFIYYISLGVLYFLFFSGIYGLFKSDKLNVLGRSVSIAVFATLALTFREFITSVFKDVLPSSIPYIIVQLTGVLDAVLGAIAAISLIWIAVEIFLAGRDIQYYRRSVEDAKDLESRIKNYNEIQTKLADAKDARESEKLKKQLDKTIKNIKTVHGNLSTRAENALTKANKAEGHFSNYKTNLPRLTKVLQDIDKNYVNNSAYGNMFNRFDPVRHANALNSPISKIDKLFASLLTDIRRSKSEIDSFDPSVMTTYSKDQLNDVNKAIEKWELAMNDLNSLLDELVELQKALDDVSTNFTEAIPTNMNDKPNKGDGKKAFKYYSSWFVDYATKTLNRKDIKESLDNLRDIHKSKVWMKI